MQKDIEELKQLTSDKCAICSKKMTIEDIYSTVTMKTVVGGARIQIALPICSCECGLAFDLKQTFIENQELDTEEVMTHFFMSNELDDEDIKLAINVLIKYEEDPLKQNLIDYLEYAKSYNIF